MYSSLRFELVFKKGKLTVASANVKSLHRFSKVQNRFLLYIFLAFRFFSLSWSPPVVTVPSLAPPRHVIKNLFLMNYRPDKITRSKFVCGPETLSLIKNVLPIIKSLLERDSTISAEADSRSRPF